MGFAIFLLFIVVVTLATVVYEIVFRRGQQACKPQPAAVVPEQSLAHLRLLPACWVVIRCRDMTHVQSALSLHHAHFCTWMEGLTEADGLFIAPPIQGWILIVGGRLPNPWKDVDACFRFVRDLSRKLGKVQLFSAHYGSLRHAWVMAKGGRIARAYAWSGQTIWKQGTPTPAEAELHLTCFEYGETLSDSAQGLVEANLAKIPQLAARWGLDPARIRQHLLLGEHGVAGQPAHRF